MALSTEALFALVTSLLLIGPTVVLWLAYGRTRAKRILLAALGFSVFLGTDVVLFSGQSFYPSLADLTEILEFVGDLGTAACFAGAFLLPGPKDEGI